MSARPRRWDIGVLLLAVVASFTTGWGGWEWIAFALVATLGIGHGALDDRLLGPKADRRSFYGRYLAGVAAVISLWLAAPTLALIVFLLLSVAHFGEAELAHLDLQGPLRRLVHASRGLVLVAWPLVLRPDDAAPVLDAMGIGLPEISSAAWGLLGALCIAQHLVVLAAVVPRTHLGREALALAPALVLLGALPLLLGFALYFCLGHAMAHLFAVRSKAGLKSWVSMARAAAPLWAIASLGLAGLAVSLSLTGSGPERWATTFIGLAVLTVPHMITVTHWHGRQSRAPRSG